MLLFSRIATLNGSPRKTMPWAVAVTDYVNAHGALPVSCWSATFGYPIGTVAWSLRTESHAELSAATAKLMTDAGYLDLLDQAEAFVTTPGEDSLSEIIYGTPGAPPQLGAVAQLTRATIAVDRMAAAIAWSIEIAQHTEGVTGSPVSVTLGQFGQMGTITWIGVVADFVAADAAHAKLAADATRADRLAATAGLFIPGSGHITQAVRIA
jgi:hypothetical protein